MEDFDVVWARLLKWLEANAPASAQRVRPPVPHEELLAAQDAFDRSWPHDLALLYERCDGTGGTDGTGADLLPMSPILSLSGMARSRARRLKVQRASPPGPNDQPEDPSLTASAHDVWAWSPRYAPFADDNFGDGYFVDLRDGPAFGSVGKWAHDDNRIAAVWPSLTVALSEVADALERSARFDNWTPSVTGSHELDWEP